MNNITIITPPDVLLNDTLSILLICPTEHLKEMLQQSIDHLTIDLNIFLFETWFDEHEIPWLLSISQQKNIKSTIIDLDNCNPAVRKFSSYFIAQPDTFYLTNDSVTPYNLISNNKVYDLQWLNNILIDRGNNE
jgi:hypothetical protein|tara:strand:- start:763 stop:1164 length:402 start_codon:yes stop_codon:yes gene_type:complete